jgi:hypothetical protein
MTVLGARKDGPALGVLGIRMRAHFQEVAYHFRLPLIGRDSQGSDGLGVGGVDRYSELQEGDDDVQASSPCRAYQAIRALHVPLRRISPRQQGFHRIDLGLFAKLGESFIELLLSISSRARREEIDDIESSVQGGLLERRNLLPLRIHDRYVCLRSALHQEAGRFVSRRVEQGVGESCQSAGFRVIRIGTVIEEEPRDWLAGRRT